MIKLVDDWRRAWKWFSVQAMALSAALLGAWEVLPADLKTLFPDDTARIIAIILLLAGLGGRLVRQESKS